MRSVERAGEQPQPHVVRLENVGDDAQLLDERGRGQEPGDDVAAVLGRFGAGRHAPSMSVEP
jgi:hypothetical protein